MRDCPGTAGEGHREGSRCLRQQTDVSSTRNELQEINLVEGSDFGCSSRTGINPDATQRRPSSGFADAEKRSEAPLMGRCYLALGFIPGWAPPTAMPRITGYFTDLMNPPETYHVEPQLVQNDARYPFEAPCAFPENRAHRGACSVTMRRCSSAVRT